MREEIEIRYRKCLYYICGVMLAVVFILEEISAIIIYPAYMINRIVTTDKILSVLKLNIIPSILLSISFIFLEIMRRDIYLKKANSKSMTLSLICPIILSSVFTFGAYFLYLFYPDTISQYRITTVISAVLPLTATLILSYLITPETVSYKPKGLIFCHLALMAVIYGYLLYSSITYTIFRSLLYAFTVPVVEILSFPFFIKKYGLSKHTKISVICVNTALALYICTFSCDILFDFTVLSDVLLILSFFTYLLSATYDFKNLLKKKMEYDKIK